MRFTITKKVTVPFAVMILLIIGTGIVAVLVLNSAEDSIQTQVAETHKEKALCRFQADLAFLLMTVNNYVVTDNRQYYEEYRDYTVKLESEIEELRGILTDPSEQLSYNYIRNSVDSIKAIVPLLLSANERSARDSLDVLINKLSLKFGDKLNKNINEYIEAAHEKSEAAHERVYDERREAFIIILINSLLAFIISIAVVILTMKRISKPILKLVEVAQRIAARDFKVELETNATDEIGMLIIAFNAMVEEISRRYEELENFSYIAAHDLKSPLSGMIGVAELILEDYGDQISKEDKELLENSVVSGTRMASLITDLLEFATSGNVEFSKVPVSMNDMLNQLGRDMEYLIKKKNVRLSIQENLPSFICDPARFPQVWNNLLSNAIKYNDSPEPKIDIGICKNAGDKDSYCFYMKDNGIGIDKKYFETIFNPFQRAADKGHYEGTGIGLAIVKRIIEFHRGKIWVESEMKKGSTFYFTIPKNLIIKQKLNLSGHKQKETVS